jgi:hypothetical protein
LHTQVEEVSSDNIFWQFADHILLWLVECVAGGLIETRHPVSADESCTVLKSLREVKVKPSLSSQRWCDSPPWQRPYCTQETNPGTLCENSFGRRWTNAQAIWICHPAIFICFLPWWCACQVIVSPPTKTSDQPSHGWHSRACALRVRCGKLYVTLWQVLYYHGDCVGQFRTPETLTAHRQLRLLKCCPWFWSTVILLSGLPFFNFCDREAQCEPN